MKRVLGTAALIVAFVLAAVPVAGAAVSPTERKLTRQVTALQKQVTTLQRQVKTLQTQMRNANGAVNGLFAVTVCLTAMTADTFQATWTAVDELAQATQGRTYFGPPQAAVNDLGACQALRVSRPRTPSVAGLSSIIAIFASSAVVNAVRLPN